MQPFVLAHPSRTSFAAIASTALEPMERKVRAYFEERGIVVPESPEHRMSGSEITGCWQKTWVSSPLQTVATILPSPDHTPDSQDDEKLEHSNNDD